MHQDNMNSNIRATGPLLALIALASAIGTQACSDSIDSARPNVDGGADMTDAQSVQDASISADSSSVDAGTIVWGDAAAPDSAAATDATVGDGGAQDASPNDGGPLDGATRDTGSPSDGALADAAATTFGNAIWAGTDFGSAGTEITVVGVSRTGNAATLAGRLSIASSDVVLSSSNGRAFALVRDKGIVKVLGVSRPWMVARDVVLTPDAGAYADNPYDVAFVPSANTAYVARYADNGLAVFNPATGVVGTSVDLSPEMAASDPDGLVDVAQLLADTPSGKVFALLQRIDQFDYSGACLAAKPLIVAVDPASGQLTGVVTGTQSHIELQGANPQQMVLSPQTRKLYVVSVGCTAGDASTTFSRRGIEEVDLATGNVRWLVQEDGSERLGALLSWNGHEGYARQGNMWFPWSATNSTLGSPSSAFAAIAPMMVAPGSLVNLATPSTGDGGTTWSVEFTAPSVVRTAVFGSPWLNVNPDPTYGVGGVFVSDLSNPPVASVRAPAFSPAALRRHAPSAR